MIKEILNKVCERQDLTYDEALYVMDKIMKGELEECQVASYLTALKLKGESITEITASAQGMRDHAINIPTEYDSLDIVGTGGDRSFTFNISSISSFVISANGIKVAKHGNRSVSSKCGSADLFEALGININLSEERAKEILDEIDLSFLFAQKYHQSMKNVGKVRKDLGVRTIFNILGPLANPALAKYMLLGVYDQKLVPVIANVLKNLKVERAMVVYGLDGLDEVTLSDNTKVCELRDGEIIEYIFDPSKYGFNKCSKEDLVGGDIEENKQIALDILNGKEGPKKDVIILNSGLAIYLVKDGLSLEDSIKLARETIDEGRALEQLNKYIRLSNEV